MIRHCWNLRIYTEYLHRTEVLINPKFGLTKGIFTNNNSSCSIRTAISSWSHTHKLLLHLWIHHILDYACFHYNTIILLLSSDYFNSSNKSIVLLDWGHIVIVLSIPAISEGPNKLLHLHYQILFLSIYELGWFDFRMYSFVLYFGIL